MDTSFQPALFDEEEQNTGEISKFSGRFVDHENEPVE